MYPVLIDYKGLILPTWHVCYAIGSIVALMLILFIRARYCSHISRHRILDLYFIAYLAGYLGARGFSIVVEQDLTRLTLVGLIQELIFFGPMTFYGGFLAAFISSIIFCRFNRLPLADIADIACIGGFAALATGRLGCFFNGDDYGVVVQLSQGQRVPWWAVTFPYHQVPLPRVPVQLLESFGVFAAVVVSIVGFRSFRKVLGAGSIGVSLICFYAVYRFFLEYLRGDYRGEFLIPWLSPAQGVSLLILLAVALSLVGRLIKKVDTRWSSFIHG